MATASSLWAAAAETLSIDERRYIDFDRDDDKLVVLSNLQKLTRQSRDECVQKRWKCSFKRRNGETIILRDLFSKLVVWVDRFIVIGDIAASYDQTHAALPWAGVRFLLQIAISNIKKFDFVVEGAENIARTIDYCTTFEHLYLTGQSPLQDKLRECLIRGYAAILQYLANAKHYFEKSTLIQVIGSTLNDKESFEAINNAISIARDEAEQYATLVRADVQNDLSKEMAALSIEAHKQRQLLVDICDEIRGPFARPNPQIDDMAEKLEEDERRKILNWISSQPYPDHHSQVSKFALKGTGQWLLQHPLFSEWMQSSMSSLLWIHGTSGTGKSTLLSIVIEDLIGKYKSGTYCYPAYFYCSRNPVEPERSQPHAILASIIRQLSTLKPSGPMLKDAAYLQKEKGSFGGHCANFSPDESCEIISRFSENRPLTIIILDALDECDRGTRHELLDSIERLLEESNGLMKILVSSRDDADLVHGLKTYPSVAISSERNSNDIESFVRNETELRIKRGRLLRNSREKETLKTMIIEELIKGACGMFRWAAMQLETLCLLKVDSDIRERLGKLPDKLKSLYEDIYDGLQEAAGDGGKRIMRNTFSWLLYAKAAVTISDFLVIVSYNPDEIRKSSSIVSIDILLDLCSNFVVYDAVLRRFRFAHLSVFEFLQTHPEYSQELSNATIAEVCLVILIAKPITHYEFYIAKQRFWEDDTHEPFLRHNFGGSLLPELVKPSEGRRFFSPLDGVDYATMYFGFHCSDSNKERQNGKLNAALDHFFGNDKCLHRWAETVLNVTKTMQHWKTLARLDESQMVLRSFLDPVRNLSCRRLLRAFFLSSFFGLRDFVEVILPQTKSCFGEYENGVLLVLGIISQSYSDVLKFVDPDVDVDTRVLSQILLRLPVMVENSEQIYPALFELRKDRLMPPNFLRNMFDLHNFTLQNGILSSMDIKFARMVMINLPQKGSWHSEAEKVAMMRMIKPNRDVELFGHKFEISPELLLETALYGSEAQMGRLIKQFDGLTTELAEQLGERARKRGNDMVSKLYRLWFPRIRLQRQPSIANRATHETGAINTGRKGDIKLSTRLLKLGMNYPSGAFISSLIFHHGGLEVLSEECLVRISSHLGDVTYLDLLRRILDARPDVKFSSRCLENAIETGCPLSSEIFELFDGPMSTALLLAAFNGPSKQLIPALQLILMHDSERSLEWDTSLEVAVVENPEMSLPALDLLEDALGPLIVTQDLIESAASGNVELMVLLLDRNPALCITDDLLIASAKSKSQSARKLEVLLTRCLRDHIPQLVLLETLQKSFPRYGQERSSLEILLKHNSESVKVDIDAMLAVAGNRDPRDIIKIFDKYQISSPTLKEATSARLLEFLVTKIYYDDYIREDVFKIGDILSSRSIESSAIEDAVRLAAIRGREYAVVALTKQFSCKNLQNRYLKIARLHHATRSYWSNTWERFNVLDLIEAAGADCDLPNPGGYTPLHIVVRWGNPELAESLLNQEANPCHKAKSGLTPLSSAAAQDDFALVRLLLKYHTNCQHASECIRDAAIAADQEDNLQMAEFLESLLT